MSIKFINNGEIDRIKWDETILSSTNPFFYGNSWYLDVVSPGWSALVVNDYEAVFPLPVKNKYGLNIVNHPLFAQRLGLFSKGNTEVSIEEIIRAIPSKFVAVKLRVNGKTNEVGNFSKRINYILKLNDLKNFRSVYNTNTVRNLKKASQHFEAVNKSVSVEEFIQLKQNNNHREFTEDQWNAMRKIAIEVVERKLGEIWGLYNEKVLVSAVLLVVWKNRVTYLFAASSEVGKRLSANFKIVDEAIGMYSGKDLILDFEGSMNENVARFFKGFGAESEYYYEIRRGLLARLL